MSPLACEVAASEGHLEVLQWLKANGCPLARHCASRAVTAGRLDILKWLWQNRAPFEIYKVTELAARANQSAVLIWLKDNGFPWTERSCVPIVPLVRSQK